LRKRIIPRLDIKGKNLIKGIQLEGVRVVGDPIEYACDYYCQGADELLLMDAVASLYQRNNLAQLVRSIAENIFVPITVGGVLRSIKDVDNALCSGADKVAINTAAIKTPDLITKLAKIYGSQCVVVSIEAKKIDPKNWEVFYNNGRERTGMCVMQWAKEAIDRGAGEVLLTSVDQEGTKRGFDISLVEQVAEQCKVPLIVSGGYGDLGHLDSLTDFNIDAVAIADAFHFKKTTIGSVKNYLDATVVESI
jgi:imidazole glycerol-phosphate synthase subunit HisF